MKTPLHIRALSIIRTPAPEYDTSHSSILQMKCHPHRGWHFICFRTQKLCNGYRIFGRRQIVKQVQHRKKLQTESSNQGIYGASIFCPPLRLSVLFPRRRKRYLLPSPRYVHGFLSLLAIEESVYQDEWCCNRNPLSLCAFLGAAKATFRLLEALNFR